MARSFLLAMLIFLNVSVSRAQGLVQSGNGNLVFERTFVVKDKAERNIPSAVPSNAENSFYENDRPQEADGMVSLPSVSSKYSRPSERSEQSSGPAEIQLANLTAYTPSGWSFPIVISNTAAGTLSSCLDAGTIYSSDIVYISYSCINNGLDPTPTGIVMYCYIYIDNVLKYEGNFTSALPSNNLLYWLNKSVGSYSAGSHTFRMEIDPTNVVPESNESDNSYQRTKSMSASATLPTITSFAPVSGPAGTGVTVTGTNFGATQGTGTIRFGSTSAAVTSWGNTQIVAVVPSLATGNYTISVTTSGGTANSSAQFSVTAAPTYSDPIPSLYKTTVSSAVVSAYINFMTERFGTLWMVGDNGLIARATSMTGGVPVSWSLSNTGIPATEDIYAVEFADALLGFVGTGTGKIFRTTDGGSSWSIVYDQPAVTNFINFIRFDNASTGMAAGDGISSTSAMAFLATTNGGATWINKNTNIVGSTSLSQVYFVTANTGFLSGTNTLSGKTYRGIFKTTNGGVNWNFYTVGNTSIDSVTYTATLSFRTTTAGIAIRGDSTVWKTGNGGSNWTKVGQLPLMGFGVVSTSTTSAFIAGRNGLVAAVNNNVLYSVQLDPSLTFSAPAFSSTYSAVLLPVFNQVRAYFSSVNPSTPLITPALQSPSNNSQITNTTAALSWFGSTGATQYDIEVGTVISSLIKGKVYTASATTYTVGNLSAGTQYQWRVRARNSTNSSAWSQTSSFTTPTAIVISNALSASFPASPKSSADYRLITFPTVSSSVVNDFISGNSPNDYRIFGDNGGIPPNHLTELSGTKNVTIGEGYWFIQKKNLIINSTLQFPSPSTTTGAVNITVRSGWNIIGTPFAVPVKWSDIRTANGLSSSRIAYAYNGASGFSPAEILEPFKGYYYSSSASTLAIPYPFTDTPDLTVQEPAVKFTLVHSSPVNSDRLLTIGVDGAAQEGMDDFEMRKPPIFEDQAAIWIDRPEWDENHSRFASDIRPVFGDGQTWQIVLQHPGNETSRLTIENMDRVPEGFEIVIVDKRSGVLLKPDRQNGVTIPPGKGTTSYAVMIGKQSYIRSQTEPFIPERFVLHQNYPNPFNPSTAIRFGIVDNAFVQLKVFDLLGREVAVVVNEALMGGSHEYWFNAKNLASGTYIYSLRAVSVIDGKVLYSSAKKMTLLK